MMAVSALPCDSPAVRYRNILYQPFPATFQAAIPEVPPVPLRRDQAALHEDHAIHEERTLEIDGTSTIGEVAARYDIPAESMKKALGIPSGIPDNERLGRLRRQYGFYMSDLERVINEYRQKNQ